MEPFQDIYRNPPINLSQIQDKELYIPIYIKDPETDEFEIVSMPVSYEKLIELFYSKGQNNMTKVTKVTRVTKEDREVGRIFRRDRIKQPKFSNAKPNPRTLGISLDSNHGLIDSHNRITSTNDLRGTQHRQNGDYFGHQELDAAATFLAIPPPADINFQLISSFNRLPGNSQIGSSSIKASHQTVNITDNIIYSFLSETCIESSSGLISRNELQIAYQSWSKLRGQPPIAGSILADYLNIIYQTTKIRKKTHYVGLCLK